MTPTEKKKVKAGVSQAAKNVAAAGAGAGVGYLVGGKLGKLLIANPSFRKRFVNMTKAEREAVAKKIRIAGATLGTAAGALSTHALNKKISEVDEQEKLAFFINYAYSRLV